MGKNIIFILAIIALSCGIAGALDKPLIDLKYKRIDEGIEKERTECKELKNPYKRISCGKKIRKKYRQRGEIRGTEEYCERKYKSYNFNQLEQLLKQMREQQKTARYSYDAMYDEDRQLGEVTKEDLQTEMIWIESRLARMQRAKTEKDAQALRYKKGWGKP